MRIFACAILLAIAGVITLSSAGNAASGDPTPAQQIAKLKQQLRNARADVADAQDEIDAQDATIGDIQAQNARLVARLANQPDPLDVITSRGPDGLWNAMTAIWRAFPTLDAGQLCGYDRSAVPGQGDGLTLTSYSFDRWSGC